MSARLEVCPGPNKEIGLEFFQIWHICLMQSAAKHMAKKIVACARCIATVLLNFIMISTLPLGGMKDFIKISAKNSKVNKM